MPRSKISNIRRLATFLVVLAQVFATPLSSTANASCDRAQFIAADNNGGCICDNYAKCPGTNDYRVDRYYCASISPGGSGFEDCQTQLLDVGDRYSCLKEPNWDMIIVFVLTSVTCTIGLAGCSAACVVSLGAACALCLLGYGACNVLMVGGGNCSLVTCYSDTDNKQDLMRDVFSHFVGPSCPAE